MKVNKIILILFLWPIALNSSAMNIKIWDNQLGVTQSNNCESLISKDIPFIITDSKNKKDKRYENLRNYLGIKQSNLPTGSVGIKSNNDKRNKTNYTFIELLGINQIDGLKQNRWFTQRGDEGYLFNNSILPIDDHVIEIQNIKDLNFITPYHTSGYYYLKCNNRNYYLFRNYKSLDSQTFDSIIGISTEETALFKDIKTHKLEDIDNTFLRNINSENEGGYYSATPFDLIEEDMNEKEEVSLQMEYEANYSNKIQTFIKEIAAPNQTKIAAVNQNKVTTKLAPIEEDAFHGEEVGETDVEDDSDEVPVLVEEEKVLCIPNEKINIRDESLDNILFQAVTGEVVQVFQGFNGEESVIKREISGIEYHFVKIKFTQREETDQVIGRVAKRFILPKSKCKYLENEREKLDKSKIKIKGLSDKLCCDFPTIKKVTHPYTSGMRRFNANRGNGTRKHAACDLYREKDEPIVAVAPGKVLRDHYYFYQGTYAIEIAHEGGFIVRYGELTGKKVDKLSSGSDVKMGDRLGYIGVVNSNCCLPMLHFELYKGDKTGPLTTPGNKFQRRSDLMDPTFYLQKWEGMTFNE